MATPYAGFGNVIAFQSFVGELLTCRLSGTGRGEIPTFHAGSTSGTPMKTYMPEPFTDPGSLNVEIHFDPADTPPWGVTEATACVVTWSDGSVWTTEGILESIDIDGPIENKMVLSGVIKLSGNIVIT